MIRPDSGGDLEAWERDRNSDEDSDRAD